MAKRKTKSTRSGAVMEKEPDYMVQIPNPRELRKELLESLRDLILFMQHHEQFKQVQDEKVKVFAQLKTQVRELNLLINTKLKSHFPKGKLTALVERKMISPAEAKIPQKVSTPVKMVPVETREEIDELEKQLQDIERQLQRV